MLLPGVWVLSSLATKALNPQGLKLPSAQTLSPNSLSGVLLSLRSLCVPRTQQDFPSLQCVGLRAIGFGLQGSVVSEARASGPLSSMSELFNLGAFFKTCLVDCKYCRAPKAGKSCHAFLHDNPNISLASLTAFFFEAVGGRWRSSGGII